MYTRFFSVRGIHIDTGIVCCPRFVVANRVQNAHQRIIRG